VSGRKKKTKIGEAKTTVYGPALTTVFAGLAAISDIRCPGSGCGRRRRWWTAAFGASTGWARWLRTSRRRRLRIAGFGQQSLPHGFVETFGDQLVADLQHRCLHFAGQSFQTIGTGLLRYVDRGKRHAAPIEQRFAALTQIAARERVERHRKTLLCHASADRRVGLDQVLSQLLDLDVLCVGRRRMIGIDDPSVGVDVSVYLCLRVGERCGETAKHAQRPRPVVGCHGSSL
jgi:hypothetical protein